MNLLIIQARMGSTRLPGKVLKTINGKTLLEWQYQRLKSSETVDEIVIATTTGPEDDVIEAFCKARSIHCYRGSDWDVLDRYHGAALRFKADTVIRVTSDCPLHHHEVVDFAVKEYLGTGADYFSNSNYEPAYLEDGFDVEVFSFRALEEAWKNAKLLSEREHVTPYIKNSGKFKCRWKKFRQDYRYKLSVDNAGDLDVVDAIFGSFEKREDFGMEEVCELLARNPGLLMPNQGSVSNSGYKKSLENDRFIDGTSTGNHER